jgi:hypothetical protein
VMNFLSLLLVLMTLSVHSAYALDQDGDGMSDVWQRFHIIATGDTASDPDRDGQSNIKEAEAGTDPRNPQDYFRTFDFSFSPASDSATLSWRSIEQRYYEIEESADLITWGVAGNKRGQSGLFSSTTFNLSSPVNDLFANRWPASSSTIQTIGSNIDATTEVGEPINPNVAGRNTVWWSWSSNTSGPVTITTTGSDFDTTLAVYSGTALSNLVLLGANDDTDGIQSAVTFTAITGVDYAIQVNSYSTAGGSIVLNHPISSGVLPPPNTASRSAPKMFFRVRNLSQFDTDSDGDSLTTWEERLLGSNPASADSDVDMLPDGWEFIHQFNPSSAADAAGDVDADGLSNLWEYRLRLNPRLTDSNGNGVSDALEDRDLDGLTNLAELTTHTTDPSQPDTDMDTLPDGWELTNGFNPTVHNGTDGDTTNDATADPDGDGLSNSQEADNQTRAKNADSDGDGVDDGTEAGQGSNPNDPNDSLPPPSGTAPVNITFGDDSGSHSEKYRVKLTPLEGDPGGPRIRTNRAYGASQTDTLQLPKGAKYKVELIHIGTKPGFREEHGFSNYDWTLSIDTSTNCLVVDDPQTIMTTVEDWPNSTFQAEGKNATLYVPLFEWVTPKASPVSAADDAGDGQNEFTFSAASPGVLTMDMKILVKPTGTAGVTGHDGVKFSDRCFYKLPTINGSTFVWDGANTGGKSAASGEHLTAKATYTTLPAANAGFGLKQAEFECDGHTDTLVKGDFEVFYMGQEKNHPAGDPTHPNWFHYYRLNEGGSDYTYDAAASTSQSLPGQPNSIQIADNAYTGGTYITTTVTNGQLTATGTSRTFKYYTYFYGVVNHERQHANNETTNSALDPDGDFLPSTFETGNSQTDPANKFSSRGSLSGNAYDDGEVYAGGPIEQQAIQSATTTEDWANPGSNSK